MQRGTEAATGILMNMTVPTPPPESTSSIKTCFVIGPIGDRLAAFGSEGRVQYEQAIQVWDYVIHPACQALGIEPIRADRIAESGEITEQVCERLRDDDLVIADVTGGNPNVMYELGMRHTKNKLTVQIGEKGRLPFDITVIRTIQFNRTETGLVEARESLQNTIRADVERGPRPVTATRVWLGLRQDMSEVPESTGVAGGDQAQTPQTTASQGDGDEELGFLDMLAETEEALPLLSRVAEELTAVLESMPALADEMMRNMAASDVRGGGAGGRLRVAKEFADRLEEPTTDLEQLAAEFVGELGRMAPGFSYLLGEIEQDPSVLGREEAARQFADAIQQMSHASEESLAQVGVLANTVEPLGKVSTRLRPVSRRMSTALRRISGSSRIIEEWGARLDALEPNE